MPQLTIRSNAAKAAGVPPKVVAQYQRFIDRLPDKQIGFLKFSAKEDIEQARAALLEAAAKSRKYITIRKARGQDRTLQLRRCSKAEFEKADMTFPTRLPPRVVRAVSRAYRGDRHGIKIFMNRPHPLLGGKTPIDKARSSSAGADEVLKLIRRAEAGLAV